MIDKIKNVFSDTKTIRSMTLNFIIKGISLLLTYLYVPLLLDYLGDEKYGLWATILSVVTWINLCDIGIGGGLRNILTEELSAGKIVDAKKTVSTAYVILSFLALAMWAILVLVKFVFNWNIIFNTNISIDLVMLISCSFICVNFVLSLVNVVQYALQISEQVAFVGLFGNAINILGILLLKQFSKGDLVYISLLYGLSTLIPLVFNNIRIFNNNKGIRPNIFFYDKSKTKKLLSLGIIFFILQIGGLMLTTTDNIIISQLYGASSVTPIEISTKLLSVAKGFYAAMMIPIWARTTKAVAERDFQWLKKTYFQLLFLLGIFGTGIFLLVVLFKPIICLWVGQELNVSQTTVAVIALGTFAEMINTTYYSMLNGMSLIKIQMYIAIIQIIVNIPLSIFLAKNMRMGVMGVKLATTILFAFSGIIYVFYTKYSINRFMRSKGV